MSDAKSLMKLAQGDLIAMGAAHGLTFNPQMRKADMVLQLQQSLASGWMDVNSELMNGIPEGDFDFGSGGSSAMISDAAHVAQMMGSAGMAASFHHHMSNDGGEMIQAYLSKLGVSSDDVWLHMPRAVEGDNILPERVLAAYMRDTLMENQEIMKPLEGHYTGDILGEYHTNRGGIEQSYDYLAHAYVDRSSYTNKVLYDRDIARVASRLQGSLGLSLTETAAVSAMGGRVSYVDALPQLGAPDIISGIAHPRHPLNASGLPLGSFGPGINPDYSLSASLSDSPSWSDSSKALYTNLSTTLKSLASVYRGTDGMNALPHVTSERDQILDSASRYVDAFDARSGYANVSRDLAGEPSYSAASIGAVLSQAHQLNEAEAHAVFDPVETIQARLKEATKAGTDFTANIGIPHFQNAARARRGKRAAQSSPTGFTSSDSLFVGTGSGKSSGGGASLDAEDGRGSSKFAFLEGDDDDGGLEFLDNILQDLYKKEGRGDFQTGRKSGPVYHDDLIQGSDEWLDFRKKYDITGSTVGSFLGSNKYNRPWAAMVDKIGLSRSKEPTDFQKKIFARGHATEASTRKLTEKEFGFSIGETGAITNDTFPGWMYSPDGLIGDDALWEHKNPERAGKFADLLAGDHPDYMDQIQMGMHLSGRRQTLFTQTIGDDVRHQWIDRDEDWVGRNSMKLQSVQARLAAGRKFVEENQNLNQKDMIKGARAAMTGDGLWKDVSQRSNAGFSPDAGTVNDPFIGVRSDTSAYTQTSSSQVPPAQAANPEDNPTALAVKQGIILANEEMQQQGTGPYRNQQATASLSGEFYDRFMEAQPPSDGGGGGRKGGGGGGRTGGSWYDPFLNGVQGGTIAGASTGVISSLARLGPLGVAAATGIGAIGIGSEAIEHMNEFYGRALDSGMTNSIEHSTQIQGLEMLGLSDSQASRVSQRTHSAYNTMLNGDPSGVVSIVKGTRGLVTVGDIRQTEGNPVALARIIRERGESRGWSQARIAGAMEMAGLQGMARTFDRSDSHFSDAEKVVADGRNTSVAGSQYYAADMAADRAALLPSHNLPQLAMGSEAFMKGGAVATNSFRHPIDSSVEQFNKTKDLVGGLSEDIYNFIAQEESGGRNRDSQGRMITSETGAMGKFQVLPSTARDPGYGIRPWDGKTDEDLERVGREYYGAMVKANHGDHRKAMAAYTDGQGTVDRAVERLGADWLSGMPAQAQKRVQRYDAWAAEVAALQKGPEGFTNAGPSGLGMAYGATRININVNATVNNKQATATVTTSQGQTVTQQVNVGNGAMTRQ